MTELRRGPSPEELAAWLRAAQDAVEECGAILMGYFEALDGEMVRSKSAPRDLVTSADLASERHLVGRLRAHFPDHAIEAEEETRDREQPGVPRWFLDPLDGTVNFVHGLPAFAVSAGLWLDDEPLVAVVHAPRLGETFSAARGLGAHRNGQRMWVRTTEQLGDALLATGFGYRLEHLADNNLGHFQRMALRVRGLRRFGSAALDLAYVAAGRFDGFWELHLSPHDVAAGGLLVREAGGIVSDLRGGSNWLRGGTIAAAGPGLHGAILAELSG